MEYLRLGASDMVVSRLGFGCCPLGGHGWGKISPIELEGAVHAALDEGINLFDTADVYGLGESERRLGRSLRGRRQEAVIATKAGVRRDAQGRTFYDNTPAWIRQALEASLDRLGVDTIDLYQLHYRDSRTPLEEVFAILEQLRTAGKIRYYGLSNISASDIAGVAMPEMLLTFQVQFSLVRRELESDITTVARNGRLSFMSWGSLGQGLLTGKYGGHTIFPPDDRRSRSVYPHFHGERLRRNLNILEGMRRLRSFPAKSLPQIALRWIMDYLGFGIVLAGMKHPSQVRENARAMGWKLSPHEIEALEAISRRLGEP